MKGWYYLTRRKGRETAFLLLFEKTFTDEAMSEIVEKAQDARDLQPDEFAMHLADSVAEKIPELDPIFEPALHNWSKERLSRVALTVLRIAVFEMRFEPDTPDSVAINEAVEIAKKYGGSEDGQFINGVLGTLAKA